MTQSPFSLHRFLAGLAAVAALALPAFGAEKSVQLLAPRQLEPTTTLEVRFDEVMVPPEQVGQPASEPPVVLRPAVKGRFVWLSQRSGSFQPEEPYALSTTYMLTLAPGLKNAGGKVVEAGLRETLKTPPMTLKGWNSKGYLSESDAPAEPKFAMLFNADVEAGQAERFVRYVNARGDQVPARVTRADSRTHAEQYFPIWRSSDRSLQTWAGRFYEKSQPASELAVSSANISRANHLWVEPVQPLPAGDDWKLIVGAGLPGTDAWLRLLEPVEIKIGTIRPFEVIEAESSNFINAGRRVSIRFSKELASEVTVKNFSRWVRIEPTPDNLKTELNYRGAVFTGDFELGRDYRVIVDPGLPAAQPFVLARGFSSVVQFSQVPPRLYFEEFTTHQLSTGNRQFHLLAVNVPKIVVTARLFAPDTAPLALAAWKSYENPIRTGQHRYDEEPFAKLDLDDLPGQTVWQQELLATTELDAEEQVALDWNEILGAHQTGVVLLTAEQAGQPAKAGARPGTQAIVQVTDLGLVWKQAKDETFVHVFSLAGGKATGGAKLRLLDADNNVLDEAVADEGGLARLKANDKARWILAESGADMHLVEFKDRGVSISLRQLGIRQRYDDEETADARQALLFTERPVYKPGETVHLKGILRDWREGRPHIPAGAKATLRVQDARERRFLNRAITMSDAGSFSEDIKLPATGLGTYAIELVMAEDGADGDALALHNFEVQEYVPNAFEIKIAPAPRAIGETPLALPVTANYYMGKKLSQARMTWSLDASDNGFAPDGFAGFDFCNAIRSYELNARLERNSHFSEQGQADLDEHGAAKVETTITLNTRAPQPRSAHLLCEITDVDQQTVSQSADFTIHSSDFYLGLNRLHDVVHEGEALPIDVIAIRTDGTPTPESVEATLRLTRIDWNTNRVETSGNGSEYRNQPYFELVAKATVKTRPVVKNGSKWTVAGGEHAPILAGKPGQYLLEAVSKDAAGREVITATSFSVYGKGETGWDYDNPYQIELTADKEEYLSGQTAKVLVKTPIAGEALVTVEREKVLRSFVMQLTGNAPVVEVPLEDGDAPNVFISVMMLRGAGDSPKKIKAPEYRVGYCQLKVARPDAKLSVYVQPEAPSYRPADEVKIGAQVLDFAGKPVANAEVTLYAVDEGVLSLMGYETPDPLAFFNQERALAVTTGLTLPTLLSEDAEERSFTNKGYLVGGGGEEGDALRKSFLACAFWNGNLQTDAEGRIAASFTAPDSLTRYRVIAVVHTARDQFGSGESAFEVNKPVMLEPALPRFANVGDKLVLRGVLHNLTDVDGEVDVQVELDATASAADTTTRRVRLPAHGTLAVDFPVEFKEPGTAVWKWSARFAGGGLAYRDAVQTTLKVGYPVPLRRELHISETQAAEKNLVAQVSPELLDGTGVVKVSITNSRAIELRESLDQVLHYPYGCVEQTTSSTLPWISMRDFRGVLPMLRKSDEDIAAAVNRGVDRLLSMQTGSGGLGYWPGAEQPLFWGSAYGGFGLTLAKRAGFTVPQEEFDRLCKYLSEQLRGTGSDGFDQHYSGGPSDRCLALYTLALAGHAEPAYHELLFKRRGELSAENRALLALAIVESNGPKAMIAELLDPAQEMRKPQNDWFWSAPRDSAMRLLAWSRFDPESPMVGKLVVELMGGRVGGHWRTTQGNCWSLLALGDYFRRAEKPDSDAAGTVTWNQQREDFAVNNGAPLQVLDFPIGKDGANQPLRLLNPDGKKVFTEVLIESRPRLIQQPQQDQGYSIRRRYAKVEDDGKLSEAQDLRVGDRVLVTLDIEVRRPARYVAVDDPLPAIFETLNPVFKSQETRVGEHLGQAWVSDYQELRDDRALFFADELYPGAYTIRYLARVRVAGTATAPSAKIEEMYHPERFGMTETLQLTSLPLK